MAEITPTFVGIDVSKMQLDIALRPSDATESVPNDEPVSWGSGLTIDLLNDLTSSSSPSSSAPPRSHLNLRIC